MSQKSKGVSTLISSTLLIALAAGAVTSTFMFISPLADSLRETRTLQTMLERMPELGEQIETVANFDELSKKEVSISFTHGNLIVSSEKNEIEFNLETGSNVVTPRTSRRFGNIRFSAGAGVTVKEVDEDGKTFFRIKNNHVEFEILDIPETSRELVGHWAMNEGEGDYFMEETGRFSEGEINDAEWRDDCLSRYCLEFDGLDSTSNIETDEGIGEELSIMLWVKPYTDGSHGILETDDTELYIDNGELMGIIEGEPFSSNTVFESEDWNHVVAQTNQSHISVFLNGQKVLVDERNENLDTPILEDQDVVLGKREDIYLEGAIDYLALFNKTLDEVEIISRQGSHNYVDSFFNTNELFLNYTNRDTGKTLENNELETYINNERESSYGFGYTEADEVGEHIPAGRINTRMDSVSGVGYELNFELLSGSDFFMAEIRNR